MSNTYRHRPAQYHSESERQDSRNYVADNCYRFRPNSGTVKDALLKLATSKAAHRDAAIAKLENYAFLEGM